MNFHAGSKTTSFHGNELSQLSWKYDHPSSIQRPSNSINFHPLPSKQFQPIGFMEVDPSKWDLSLHGSARTSMGAAWKLLEVTSKEVGLVCFRGSWSLSISFHRRY